jgi:glutathionylspermidine synthase
MKRIATTPRADWPRLVEAQGFHFHSSPEAYWDESTYYEFTAPQIDVLEAAANSLHGLCLKAVEYVVGRGRFADFGITGDWVGYVTESWRKREPSIYGRFDFVYDGSGPPKLLEYNADTPTALLEAAVIQWYWLQDTHSECDQFNSIHERLIDVWQGLQPEFDGPVHFAAQDESVEDYLTVNYLRDTAMQAGLETVYLAVEQIGWHRQRLEFVDLEERPIRQLFKLYPWEWLMRDEFGPNILRRGTRWFEPAWKMILSNKAILAVLWELFPDHPNLLRAELEPFGTSYVRKPRQSREGANVQIVFDGQEFLQTDGPYGGPYVYQDICPPPKLDGRFPVLGCWVVADTACGLGVRESADLVTRNTSRFVPHLFG